MRNFHKIGLAAGAAAAALAVGGGIGWIAGANAADAAAAAAAASTGPLDAAGLPATGPFIPCGPQTGQTIGRLAGPFRANPAAAPAPGAGRGGGGAGAAAPGQAAGAPGAGVVAQGAGGRGGAGAPAAAGGGRGVMANGQPIPTTNDPKILAAMRAAVDPRGGNGGQPNACNWADNKGFVSLFDGTLKGWDGDPRFWRADKDENGDPIIVGESNPQNPSGNQYLTYRNIKAHDFDFKADIKIPVGGSGLQYRSVTGIQWRAYAGPAGVYQNKWMDTGPQSDLWSGNNNNNGQAYSENTPMGIEAYRGQVVEQFGNDRSRKNQVGQIAPFDTLSSAINVGGWNHLEIITRGPVMMHFMNGQLTAVLIDDDPKSSNNQTGMFGLEIETTTTVQMKNVYVKKLN